jgi:TonB family protein
MEEFSPKDVIRLAEKESRFFSSTGFVVSAFFHISVIILFVVFSENKIQIPLKYIEVKIRREAAQNNAADKISPEQIAPKNIPQKPSFAKNVESTIKEILDNLPRPKSQEIVSKPIIQTIEKPKNTIEEQAGEILGNNEVTGEENVVGYQEILSLWLQKFQTYPIQARQEKLEGIALLRLKIRKDGKILSYEVVQKTPHEVLNRAVENLAVAADPAPIIPENFVDGDYATFLVPIAFQLNN